MLFSAEHVLFVGSILLILSIFAGKFGYKLGVPALLIFLCVGMIVGSGDYGLNVIDPKSAQFVGVIALTIILFSGGLDTKYNDIKSVIKPGISLATVGVIFTALFTGLFIYFLFQLLPNEISLSLPESLLLASVMSSTDSASVFSILRSKDINLKQKLRPTLELESGSNDPMAYMLTIILVQYIQIGEMNLWGGIGMLFTQLIIGALMGYLMGQITAWIINKINIDNASLYPILVLAFACFIYALTDKLYGNGYLAVYIAGLVVGNKKLIHKKSIGTFFDGFSWLWQLVMFLTLGFLVNPKQLLGVAVYGLAIGLFVMIFARPLSVFISLFPFKQYTINAKGYISWIGLRGAAPILFATYPWVYGLENAELFFNVVFFITILSMIIQGSSVAWAAKKLLLVGKKPEKRVFDVELPEEIKSAMSEIAVTESILEHGNMLMKIDLPDHTLVVMVKRKGKFFIPKGNTELLLGDKLLVISDDDEALMQSYKVLGVEKYTLNKNS